MRIRAPRLSIPQPPPPVTNHLQRLLDNNRKFAANITNTDPGFFTRRAGRQEPHFLFIGCSDSRVPIELLTGVEPGEMFVHRNIANQVVAHDLNLLSVLQFAVDVLHVEHVIVCGHSMCGGVQAAMSTESFGLVDHWLAGVREVRDQHALELANAPNDEDRVARLVELNVHRQVQNLARTPIIQNAWTQGERPTLHGLVYDIRDGILRPVVPMDPRP